MLPLRPPATLLLRLRRHTASAAVDPTRPAWTPAAVPPPTDAAALAAAHGDAPALVAADGRVMTCVVVDERER